MASGGGYGDGVVHGAKGFLYRDRRRNVAPDLGLSTLSFLQPKDSNIRERASIADRHEQVGLEKILSLLESEDANVRIGALKEVVNLAAEETNQEEIVKAGGLTSLLMILKTDNDESIRRTAAGAITNLAMNDNYHELIMSQSGVSILALTAADTKDPQTLCMVAGAIANLCANEKVITRLRSEGGIRALLAMVKCESTNVLREVARGIANIAQSECRASTLVSDLFMNYHPDAATLRRKKSRPSLLIEDGALPWIVKNANSVALPIRHHLQLALCLLAKREVNAKDLINGSAIRELVRISKDFTRDDLRDFIRSVLNSSSTFHVEKI